jgi:hypothetical protein
MGFIFKHPDLSHKRKLGPKSNCLNKNGTTQKMARKFG